MKKYAVHIGPSGATFVKDYDFFASQGGLTENWGRTWTIIEAESLEDARVKVIAMPGARSGLYCAKCGKTKWDCYEH